MNNIIGSWQYNINWWYNVNNWSCDWVKFSFLSQTDLLPLEPHHPYHSHSTPGRNCETLVGYSQEAREDPPVFCHWFGVGHHKGVEGNSAHIHLPPLGSATEVNNFPCLQCIVRVLVWKLERLVLSNSYPANLQPVHLCVHLTIDNMRLQTFDRCQVRTLHFTHRKWVFVSGFPEQASTNHQGYRSSTCFFYFWQALFAKIPVIRQVQMPR